MAKARKAKTITMGSARRARGLQQTKLAEMLGLDQSKVSRIERGSYEPRVSLARRIAKIVEVPLDRLRFAAEGEDTETTAESDEPKAPLVKATESKSSARNAA